MLKLTCDIQIGDFHFHAVHSVEVDSSWDNLTDTCTLIFPRKTGWKGRMLATGADPIFKKEMPVLVKLGYDGDNREVFRGFIRDISAEIPVKLICEDAMFLLKKGEFNASYRSVKTSEVVSDALESIGSDLPYKIWADATLGQLRISKTTPAKVLKHLGEQYMIRAWCREGRLNVGLAYISEGQKTVKLRFDRNVISHSLEWREKDAVRLQLEAVIVKPGNGSETVKIGDEDGEKHTFHYYNMSIKEAEKLLEREIERLRYTGYRGSLTTFGKPSVRHGDFVELADPLFPERAGKYLAKRVKTSFGMGGFRQEIELESKA